MIEQKVRTLWEALVADVERDVSKFQQDFPDDKRRSLQFDKTSLDAFRVHRANDPIIDLDVHLDIPQGEIEFTEKENSEDDALSGSLFVRVDTKDNLYLTQYGRDFFDMNDAARLLLEPVFRLLTTEGPS